MLYCVTLTSRYLFSRNLLRLDAFHYTNSFNHKLYTWRGTLKSSNLLPRQRQNPHYWFSQPKSSLRLFGLSHTSTTSVLFKDLRLARAASWEKKRKNEILVSLAVTRGGSTISVIQNKQLVSYQCWKSLVQVSLSVISDGLGLGGFLTSFLFLSLHHNLGLIGNHLINHSNEKIILQQFSG